MSTIENYKKLPKDVSSLDDLDFAFLKKTGIEYIESMGGGLWSDLNDHDPGVTTLEMLAYAITDLGARINLPIETLIASEDDPELRNQFYRAEEILPTCPVTPLDYRKLFIDIEGVRNCWIVPYEKAILHVNCTNSILAYEAFLDPTVEQTTCVLQGLNCLLVDYEPDAVTETVDNLILAAYHANRNLCEDLVEIKAICEKPVSVCASIELNRDVDQNVVHAQIIDAINQYFSTEIRRYSLKEMLDKGYRMDQVFEGPLLDNGFIDTKELIEADLRSEVRLSDIINLIMSVPGVLTITNISMDGCGESGDGSDWLICIPADCKPILAPTPEMDPLTGDCTLKSIFSYKKDVLPVLYDQIAVQNELDAIQAARDAQNALALLDMFPVIPTGNVLEIEETTTIMNDYPETYGIGLYGLPGSATEKRRAQAKQLKGYLLFFDQVLATYFAHLGKIKDLFSMNSGTAPTYFTQAIQDVKGLEDLIINYELNDNVLLSEALIQQLDDNIARRNEILNHLLARFAEQFSEYAFILREMYGTAAEELLIQSKEQFLAEFIPLSRRRGKGFNYRGDVWDTENVSGLQHRVARKTGIANYSRRDLIGLPAGLSTFPGPGFGWVIVDEFINQVPFDPNVLLPPFSTNALYLTSNETNFTTACEAHQNRIKAVELLLTTTTVDIDTAFGGVVTDGLVVGNVKIIQTGDTVWSFAIIDSSVDPAVEYAFGTNYNSAANLQAAINYHITTLSLEASLAVVSAYPVPEEGIFLVEHILMRPNGTLGFDLETFLPICVENCEDKCAMDPYSFRVSVVIPGTSDRFSDPDFRSFMDRLIREEMPSHVLPRICFIDECQLIEFQEKYHAYLDALATDSMTDSILKEFIAIFTQLRTVYPTGRLFDCESTDLSGRIVLGRSNI